MAHDIVPVKTLSLKYSRQLPLEMWEDDDAEPCIESVEIQYGLFCQQTRNSVRTWVKKQGQNWRIAEQTASRSDCPVLYGVSPEQVVYRNEPFIRREQSRWLHEAMLTHIDTVVKGLGVVHVVSITPMEEGLVPILSSLGYVETGFGIYASSNVKR